MSKILGLEGISPGIKEEIPAQFLEKYILIEKAGRALSGKNWDTIQTCHDNLGTTMAMMKSLLDETMPSADEPNNAVIDLSNELTDEAMITIKEALGTVEATVANAINQEPIKKGAELWA